MHYQFVLLVLIFSFGMGKETSSVMKKRSQCSDCLINCGEHYMQKNGNKRKRDHESHKQNKQRNLTN